MFQYIADFLTYSLLGLVEGEQFAQSVHFFVYDVFKILFLIFFVVSFIAFLRTFFAPGKIKRAMAKMRFGSGNLLAACFGAVTPFCSCSSIPLFIGFLKARVPAGVAFSFLVTSPLVNEVAFVIMGGLFGWKLAVLYAISGILLGVFAGLLLGAFNLEKNLILEEKGKMISQDTSFKGFKSRIRYAFQDGRQIFKKIYLYIIAGVAVGAAIHGYVPDEFFVNYVGKYELLSVPLAVILGVPIYAGCSTVAPVIFSITQNGVPLGTSMAFMMSIAGLSLPEAVMLKRVLSLKLLAIFFGIVAAGIVAIGYLFNIIS
ncbi:MAG: permease [Patescibacteria group bacterium]|nr:permease [Patescibacteria group bacterium]